LAGDIPGTEGLTGSVNGNAVSFTFFLADRGQGPFPDGTLFFNERWDYVFTGVVDATGRTIEGTLSVSYIYHSATVCRDIVAQAQARGSSQIYIG
jgi:hypothetical protein